MLRITADTNIYISGLNFGGIPLELLVLGQLGYIEVAISEPILAEIRRVLRTKFRWFQDDLEYIDQRIRSYTRLVEPSQRVEVVRDDPSDNRILECAVAGASNYIVSGDRHLLQLRQFADAPIVSPADFLRLHNAGTLAGPENAR